MHSLSAIVQMYGGYLRLQSTSLVGALRYRQDHHAEVSGQVQQVALLRPIRKRDREHV